MDRQEFVDRLDDRLRTDDYADLDASANGLQVGRRSGTVDRVAIAVDAAEATIEAAIDRDADVLLVHHGLVWGGLDRLTGLDYDRIEPLVENDVALYVSHLPLDGHQELGNAAILADRLGLAEQEPFGEYGTEYVGVRGTASDAYTTADLSARLDAELDTETRVLGFGPDEIEDVGIITGRGVDWIEAAAETDLDAFITGEGKHESYHEARDLGVNVFLAGHYATETLGVRAVGELAEKWGLETTFIEHPTGL
ncbi:Nif3-like dinuclear metal center hexameric protein [Haloplanus aerogenes]|uniref:Dinuclear metal center YbgI/SA1388 family protein n=1 Tax=Haloplanus aerogenes TaxID=660522 RepID=A0A3M0CV70_9EURY|nr:Nif3-like dinuclear metal center hexameric protein [Haloplanus aerogenes]AZH26669.1 Nif3-like dinuclear metal center hexameric protein [Haloplanus aerogenes]RMB12907.1 dinuclear metal center YbgI/SA1388 family protein [Haloplanus aerogenes]